MPLQNVQLELANAIFGNDEVNSITPTTHLEIYRHNIHSTLSNTLSEIYPMIIKLVGYDFFQLLTKDYIDLYPSRSSNLHDYGNYFSDFLANHAALKQLVYISEVARFEWICHSLFFAADAQALDVSYLQQLQPDEYSNLHVNLNPASILMKFYYPILEIIELCQGTRQDNINLNSGGIELLIIRRHTKIKLIPLDESDFSFLSCLQQGMTLAQALAETQQYDAHFDLPSKLVKWVTDKSIVGFY